MTIALFPTSTTALVELLSINQVIEGACILLPDYYCEETSQALSFNWTVSHYPLDENLLPELPVLFRLIDTVNPQAVIVLIPFNLEYDLASIYNTVSAKGVLTILDCAHSYPLRSTLQSFPFPAIFSIRKPLCLSEGAIYYVPDTLTLTRSKTIASLSFNPIRVSISILKLIRLALRLLPLRLEPTLSKVFQINLLAPNKPSSVMYSTRNKPKSISFIDALLLLALSSTSVHSIFASLLNRRAPHLKYPADHYPLAVVSTKSSIQYMSRLTPIRWPIPIGEDDSRTHFWTANADRIYRRIQIFRWI